MNDFQKKIADLEAKINDITEAKINGLSNDNSEPLQRTEDWFEARRGKFTGSRIKDLMKCSRAGSRMPWGDKDKTIDLGDGAIKYIYSKAMERKHKYYIKTYGTRAMSYGTENEDVIKNLYREKYPDNFIEECDFVKINDYLGASPDGLITTSERQQKAMECKAATTFEQFYNRVEVPFDEKHMDFWQVQTEMMALEVESCEYVVALPPHDIMNPEIKGFENILIKSSPIHQNAILQRASLGNSIIELFLTGVPFAAAIQQGITVF